MEPVSGAIAFQVASACARRVQVVERLSSKHEALSSNPSAEKRKAEECLDCSKNGKRPLIYDGVSKDTRDRRKDSKGGAGTDHSKWRHKFCSE
jgi:hypothetical protein